MTQVYVVTGFLGSGKTTLIARLLQDPALADTAASRIKRRIGVPFRETVEARHRRFARRIVHETEPDLPVFVVAIHRG